MDETPETKQPAKKRRWFQFHLSTAIVMMFVAGGLLWANLHHRVVESGSMIWDGPIPGPPGSSGWAMYQRWGYGFPFEAVGTDLDVQGCPLRKNTLDELSPAWHWVGLLGNLTIGIVVVLLVGSACEWLIRRRERKT